MLDMKKVVEMRCNGATMAAIAKEFGKSTQYVSAELQKLVRVRGDSRRSLLDGIIYPKLVEYMLENNHTFSSLERLSGVPRNLLRKKLCGDIGITKRDIDGLIKATGIPYEELFKEALHHG